MASNKYIDVGTSLTSSFYLRNYYSGNRDARTSSKRNSINDNELSLADSQALRRAVRNLGSFEFDEDDEDNIRNSVLAFIDTYNNTLESAKDSGDHTLNRNMKQLKSITKEYASDLDKLGITVNDDGTLDSRSSLFDSVSISKFKNLFSADSTYMQRTNACAKRMERRSETLILTEKWQASANKKSESTGENTTDNTLAEQFSDNTDLDMLLNTGIGQNVNISL